MPRNCEKRGINPRINFWGMRMPNSKQSTSIPMSPEYGHPVPDVQRGMEKVAHHHAAIPDPAIRHAVNLERDEVEEALELKHEKMSVRLASLKTSAKKGDQVRETKVKREMNEGLDPWWRSASNQTVGWTAC